MATIAEFRIPASDTALGATFHAVPSLVCEIEPVIAADEFGMWMSGADRAALNAALREDRTVRDHSLITSDEARRLYTIHFSNEIAENFSLVAEEGGTMLAASARAGMWTIRLRFPARENASRVYERLAARDIQIEITQIRSLTTTTADDLGLSPAQYEALTAALTYGYFEIPREISLEELAAKLDISHQALSERFRRAYRTLVASSLEFDARCDFTGTKPSE
ncbi:Bacterio-opsin activator HTH domain protein [Haloterrigena turkmenica DSM 5511]|uniref:Bacterio-opsin activator HTH domain protein n=1 Tax=Haloterrigena turkmenica (strain ATCC 51198 / DSM 5511 / JCM 9101 / NCIMB 13204 / VKM B-1734 / 4k) TaxID=543526 RepID=D2RPA5_HALTV|nr:helix-turn-helix domain-containing protein [Haloterrigena turkmenica]ADB60139.1 Bacterio-opsin activator HTH domain protein [Haloterrigena turkmenica DSM 5511]